MSLCIKIDLKLSVLSVFNAMSQTVSCSPNADIDTQTPFCVYNCSRSSDICEHYAAKELRRETKASQTLEAIDSAAQRAQVMPMCFE